MEVAYATLIGFLCLVEILIGLTLTAKSYQGPDKDAICARLLWPVEMFTLLLVCYSVWGVMTLFDELHVGGIGGYGFWEVFLCIAGAGVVFSVKNIVAPLMIAIAFAWSTYQFMTYGVLEFFPAYEFFVEILLYWAPQWVQMTYLVGMFGYMLLMTVLTIYE